MQFDVAHITSLFENATEGFVVSDSEGEIILVNPSACRMFAYTKDELIGRKIELLIPSRYAHKHVQLRDGFYRDPRNRVMGHGRDLHGQRQDGSNFPVEVSLSTYMREGKRYTIAFIIDITGRKQIEENMLRQQEQLEKVGSEIRALNAELEMKVEERTVILKEALQRLEQSQQELSEALDKERQLNEIKSRFVSMASHEFRTPLSTVLSSASLLARYTTTDDQPSRTRHIEKIRNSVKHLNDLLEDFLSLGRLDEGRIAATMEDFSLPELLEEIVEEMKGLAKAGQQIVLRHEGPNAVFSDPRLVKNILINLISNAIKFSGEHGTIHVHGISDGERATLSVRDEGIGIPPDDLDHLFTSFFRGRNAVNIQGTGLGLHIVKRYLELLQGTIRLTSELGKGTEIAIDLPVKNL